jgi:hypothetical protein
MNPIWFPLTSKTHSEILPEQHFLQITACAGTAALQGFLSKKPPAGRVSFLQAFISMYCFFGYPESADAVFLPDI